MVALEELAEIFRAESGQNEEEDDGGTTGRYKRNHPGRHATLDSDLFQQRCQSETNDADSGVDGDGIQQT